jgi:Tfp pilus assembly protein PilF
MSHLLSISLLLTVAGSLPLLPQGAPNKSAQNSLNDTWTAAMNAMRARHYAAAVPLLVQVTTLAPNQHVAWANLGEAYGNLAKSKPEADRPQFFAKAVDCYRKAIALKPDQASYLVNYGIWLAKTGQISEAEASLEKAVHLDPANAGTYYFNMGAILANSGHDGPAIAAFQKVPSNSAQFANARTQAFRLTLGLYIDSAKTQFEALKGKRQISSTEVTVWDVTVKLPGADYCGIFLAKTSQLTCSMSASKDIYELRDRFNSLISIIQSDVPNDWTGAVIADVTEEQPTYHFTGPHVQISLQLGKTKEGPQLSIAVAPH